MSRPTGKARKTKATWPPPSEPATSLVPSTSTSPPSTSHAVPGAATSHNFATTTTTRPVPVQLVRMQDVPRRRRDRGSGTKGKKPKTTPFLSLPGGSYVWRKENVAHTTDPGTTSAQPTTPTTGLPGSSDLHDDLHLPSVLDGGMQTIHNIDPEAKTEDRVKKEKQWKVWEVDVIPILIDPYLQLVQETTSWRERPKVVEDCGCQAPGRRLEVLCVFFDRKHFPFDTRKYV